MEIKFYRCKHCGNIIAFVKSSGAPVMCCGEKMDEIIPNTSDGAGEKHLPVVTQNGNKVTVTVGSAAHPMGEDHYIGWVCLQTSSGNQRKLLKLNGNPEACFMVCDGDKVEAAYAYCNKHGLWKTAL